MFTGALTLAAALAAGSADATPVTRRLAGALVGLYTLQLGIGLVNVWLLAPIAVQLLHLLISDLIWAFLVLLTASALADPLAVEASQPSIVSAARS